MTDNTAGRERRLNLSTFLCLYVAQMVPSSFMMTALQVTMRQGHYNLAQIGLLQLLRLPWLIKFLWSPLIDRHCATTRDYKLCIICSELAYAVGLLCAGMMDINEDIMPIMILFFVSMIASATQDIATDALSILTFHKEDRSMLNSMQSMGAFGGTVVGSGLLLMVLHRYGWHVVVVCLAAFVLLMIVPLIFNKHIAIQEKKEENRARLSDFIWFFTRRKIWPQIGFLVLYYMGIIGILSTIRPLLVDKGYSIHEIGFMTGILGTSVSFLMAWFSGVFLRRVGLAKGRLAIAAFMLLGPAYFLAISFFPFSKALCLAGIIIIQACYGLATVVVYTSAMQCVRPGREGTDFTIQIVITHISSMLIAMAAGSIGHLIGYRGIYAVELVICLLSLIYIPTVMRKQNQ